MNHATAHCWRNPTVAMWSLPCNRTCFYHAGICWYWILLPGSTQEAAPPRYMCPTFMVRGTLNTALLHIPPCVQLVFTTATGEIVDCGEEQGVTEGIRGPPEEEEEEEPEAEEEEGAAPGGGDAEVHPAPRGQDTDPHGFPLKTSFYIKPAELPARVRAITVQVTNFGGAGMANARALAVRVADATDADPIRHRDLFVSVLQNGKGAHGNRTVAVLAQVYKENTGACCGPAAQRRACASWGATLARSAGDRVRRCAATACAHR